MAVDIRRQKYKKYRIEGLNAYQSAIKAGYSHSTALNAYRAIEAKIDFDALMIKHGLDDDTLMQELADGLKSMKVISAMVIINKNKPGSLEQAEPEVKEKLADEKTIDFIDIPDRKTRHLYLVTALKLKGKLNEKIDVNAKLTVVEMKTIEIVKEGGVNRLLEFNIG